MKSYTFLDYDGVIGDSINECFASSWTAYYSIYKKVDIASVSLDHYFRFRQLRPFIRSGEDFMAIHMMCEEGFEVNNQNDFDSYIDPLGTKKMKEFRELFYQGRNLLIEQDFKAWCSLNPLYPHMKKILKSRFDDPGLYILSTKRSEYIVKILEAESIFIDPARVLYNGPREKFEVILDIIGDDGKALFLEDQIDHLLKCTDPRIDPRLVTWGYIKPEWLGGPVKTLNITEGEKLLTIKY